MASRSSNWFNALFAAFVLAWPVSGSEAFVNFETAPVHPIALSPNGATLAVCNLPDARLELFTVDHPTDPTPVPLRSVPVGLDPVSVRFRSDAEAWVVNHISDSISVVDLASGRVVATLDTFDTPSDVVFAGTPVRAFVSCARPNIIQVFDPGTRQLLTNLVIDAERPKALAVSPDGQTVYAAIFESGNGTTVLGASFKNQLFIDNVVALTNAPSGGLNPPPNTGTGFRPPLNPAIPTNTPPPGSGLIVRKNAAGRWLDDQQRDWTEFVSGTNAPLTQRVPGWDLPDRDLAVIDANTRGISYVRGLMNICMDVAVNPVSGRVAVVGTEARNEVRFEPNLNGTFAQVMLALIDPPPAAAGPSALRDLNPHLDYLTPTVPAAVRDLSIGDPRAIAWSADGAIAYVAGMGSRNLIVLNADGTRRRAQPIELGDGPCGLALDDARGRLYVYHRFASSVSVVDTRTDTVLRSVPLFDPTPLAVAAGRRHLYDTRLTSGLGHVSCATCHVDARMDRLAWDLGNPAGDLDPQVLNQQGVLVTNVFHPMKGAMLTQTLQDIIGHEPFHWRGDRPDLEAFNPAFTRLQGRPAGLTSSEMREFREFLASIRLPPNPYRALDNSLPASLPLPGQFVAGLGGLGALPAGTPLPNGNALAGITAFNRAANFCNTCHTLPTGLGLDSVLDGNVLKPIPTGPNDGHHFPVSIRLEGSLRAKNAQFRNLADRVGMTTTQPASRAGFGFGHDGSVDSLTRFLVGLRVVDDQEIADLIALLLSVAGADLATPGAVADLTPPAAVGRQLTIRSPARPALFDPLLALARSATSRVDLVVKGVLHGQARGWFFDRALDRFQSDRAAETASPDQLLAEARDGQELTLTVVSRGEGRRLGIDRDADGALDQDELDAGTHPADRRLRPEVRAARTEIPVGSDLLLEARLPPLPAAGTIAWWFQGQMLPGETNSSLLWTNTTAEVAGDYSVQVTTPFESLSSPPLRIQVVPLVLTIAPAALTVRQGSNAVLVATAEGSPPFAYQWLFNDAPLANAATASLLISNVQLATEGFYRVTAMNSHGRGTSGPVWLGVLINPRVIIPPLNQSVTRGANATFAFRIEGHPPPFGYQLRRSTTLVTQYVGPDANGFLTLSNVQPSDAATYRIVVTNAANPSPGLSIGPLSLGLLADIDQDGLPDAWEFAHGLNPIDAADADADADGDGLSNYREYLAGTEPLDPASVLRIDRLFALPGGESVLQFHANSNRTYAVQVRDALPHAPWRTLSDFIAGPNSRSVMVTNPPAGSAEGYFRLVSPRP